MKTLCRSFVQAFKRGNSNLTKILLLGAGLAMGLVLIAKIYFEHSYENFVPDVDRVYKVLSIWGKAGEKPGESSSTSGAIAPGIKAYSPAVETATRYTFFDDDVALKRVLPSGNIENGSCKAERMIYVDSSFFDIFQRKIYVGDSKHLMQERNTLMVSRSFAERLNEFYGNKTGKSSFTSVVGMVLAPDFDRTQKFTIGGIYEDFPDNSSLHDVEVLLSLPTIIFPGYDGTNNWVGNDRYISFVKLHEGADVSSVRAGIIQMCNERIPKDALEKMNMTLDLRLASLPKLHMEDPEISSMCQMLMLLAIIVFVAAVLNYILIAISSMVSRAKIVAVHKCYGASKKTVYGMALSDTFAHLVISLVLAVVIVLVNKGLVEELLDASLSSLFVMGCVGVLSLICVFIFFICGVVPGYLYAKVPIATAFRGYRENSRKWKLSLLFVQFVASAFFISLLLIVALQYRLVLGCDMGYNIQNVLSIDERTIPVEDRMKIEQEMQRLPYIKKQAFCCSLPFNGGMSGNNIILPNADRECLNITDLYAVDEEYLNLLEVPLIMGSTFDPTSTTKQVMVSRGFVERMKQAAGWDDDVIGRQIGVSEHDGPNEFHTICGVYENYSLYTALSKDASPTVQFFWRNEKNYMKDFMAIHLIKVTDITSEHLNEINTLLDRLAPGKELSINVVADEYVDKYSDSRRFRDSVLIAGLVVLIITLIGLIGYSRDEVNRRRSEIAIRKINGATVPVLLCLFLNNIVKMALPAIVLGCVFGYLASGRWLEQYSEKVGLDWWLFGLCGAFALLLIVAVVLCTVYKAANTNPVENLKCE